MHKGDNQGEDRQPVTPEEIKINNSEKILEEIQSIRNSVKDLKKEHGVETEETVRPTVEAGKIKVPAVGTTPAANVGATSNVGAPTNSVTAAAPAANAGTTAVPAEEEPRAIIDAAKVAAETEAMQPALDKVIKAIVDEEREVPREEANKSVDFASKYKDHMMRQVADNKEKEDKRAQRTRRREEARKEKDHQKALKSERKAEQKRRKKEEEEARKKDRELRAKEAQQKREIRAEVRRKKKLAKKSAQYGGGVVQYHDTQINTEVQPVARFSLMDLLGFSHREKIKAAQTEEEKENLKIEQDMIAQDARQAATQLSRVRASRFRNTAFGRAIDRSKNYFDIHKKLLLGILAVAVLMVVGIAGYFNYYTLYEYSYNGQLLGYVKNKDDVLRITDMVQKALTTDKDIQVVIDDKKDIEFKKVSTLDPDKDIVADTSDEVLRQLTYMRDLNVKAWGIYADGRKVGAVQKKEDAADVLRKLEKKYSSGKKGAIIEKAEIQENIEVKKSNTDLSNVLSSDDMVEKLCTSEDIEKIHTIVADETLDSIAEQYRVSKEDLLMENEGIDPENLTAGDTLLIRKTGPPVTVRITEKRTYEQKIEFETEERRTDEMYEGDVEVKQEGKNGRERITERTVSINGDVTEKDELEKEVMRKAVKKIMIVGTAERPPSVGDGVYIWPMAGGYTLTSGFGRRWGRLHAGIDLATGVGNDVLAADGGIVTRSGYFGGYGLCVDVDHQNGQSTRYAHLSQSLVSPGDEVYEGQHIAESGNSGFSTGAHLHFEIHIGGSAVDPMPYMP